MYPAYGQGIGDRNRPSGRGSINIIGKVYLPDGKSAVGFKVDLDGADFNNGSTTTDQDGVFVFSSLPTGNYTVTVREKGYETESERLIIHEGTPAGQAIQLAIHLRAKGQPKTAKNPLLTDVPQHAVDKYLKAIEKLSKNDAKGAIVHFQAAIEAHPNFALAYYEKGNAHLKLNEFDAALEAFVNAVSIRPDYIEAKYSVGYTQFSKKNYEVAAAVFDDVLKQKDIHEARMYLGASLAHLNKLDAAETQLKAAIAANDSETTALAHRYLGGIYLQKKRNSDAAEELQKYLDLVPKAPDADRLKATIAELKKKP